MDNKITLTISSLFNGEGFDKAGTAVKGMSKSVKDTSQAVGALAGEMSGFNGTVGKVADGVGKLMGALTGGGLSLAIAALTTVVGMFVKWHNSIEETRKKNRELMEEMEDGYGKKVAYALDYARRKQEEFLNLLIDKGKTAIERLERIKNLQDDLANAKAETSNAENNLGNQTILTEAERRKSNTTNQFDQRQIDLDTRQQMNQRNRNQLNRDKKAQDERLNSNEQLLKDKINEWERQKNSLPQEQKNRRDAIQRQIDEKNREMAVQQERINYYYDQSLNGEITPEEYESKKKQAGDRRTELSKERQKLQEELAKLEKKDKDDVEKINDNIEKARNDLAKLEEKRKAEQLKHDTEIKKLEQEEYKIKNDRNKLADDRKKHEEEEAKKAKEQAQKEAKDKANANANDIEAEGQRQSSSYQSKEARDLVETKAKIDALNAKKNGLSTPEEISAWQKEMSAAQKEYQDAIRNAQEAVNDGKEQQSEEKYELTQEMLNDVISKRDYLQNKLDNGNLTQSQVEKLTEQINKLNGEANRLRNSELQQAADRTRNAKPEEKLDAIKKELALLKDVAQDIRNESANIANNTRQNAADNLTGEQRKNNRNNARDQELLNKRIERRERAQREAADRDIENGGWFLDENGELKSTKGNMAPHLSKFQRDRLINRLKQRQLENQQKAVAQRIQQLQQQQINAINQVPPKLDEIKGLLDKNLKELNKAMKVN